MPNWKIPKARATRKIWWWEMLGMEILPPMATARQSMDRPTAIRGTEIKSTMP
jgi:hypothetical protein